MISAQPLGRREGLEIEFNHLTNDSIIHASMKKFQWTLWTQRLRWASWLVIIHWWIRGLHVLRTWKLHMGRTRVLLTPKDMRLSKNLPYMPLQLASPDLYSLFKKNKQTIIISMVLSWVLWAVLANYQTWKDSGNSWICS